MSETTTIPEQNGRHEATPTAATAAAPASAGPSLAERKAAAMQQIPTIQKAGSMVLQGRPVPYMANDDLSEALRPILGSQGLSLSLDVREVKRGLKDPIAVQLDVTLACPGERETVAAYGEGNTFAIAQTYALKYWLMRTFLIGGGDADDELANAAHEDEALVGRGRRRKSTDGKHPAADRAATRGNQAPAAAPAPRRTRPAEGEEEVRTQEGSSRPAPPTAFRNDAGRQALMRKLRDVSFAAFPQYKVDEHGNALCNEFGEVYLDEEATRQVVSRRMLELHRERPDMVVLNSAGKPDATQLSNDQLVALIAWFEALGEVGDDVPF